MGCCVAVIGTGGMGMRHLAILDLIDGIRTIAVPKRPGRARELAEQGIESAGDLAEAKAMGATLGVIATDTGHHLADGTAAISEGLDVLLEKPMATNACDAILLRDRAKEENRQVYVACVLRFSESLNVFRDLLPKIGDLHSVRVEAQSYLPDWRPDRHYLESFRSRPGEGGVLLDLIHEIDYTGWIFGWPSSVHGRVKNLGRLSIEADESAHLTWETPDGAVVSVAVDFLSQPTRRGIMASGEHGTLEWNGVDRTVTLMLSGEDGTVTGSTQTQDEILSAQTQAFLDTMAGNGDPRLATSDDGVRALLVCDAARQSSESKREEAVDYL